MSTVRLYTMEVWGSLITIRGCRQAQPGEQGMSPAEAVARLRQGLPATVRTEDLVTTHRAWLAEIRRIRIMEDGN